MSFLSLPFEIREMIYGSCLVSDRPIDIQMADDDDGIKETHYKISRGQQAITKTTSRTRHFHLIFTGTEHLYSNIIFCNRQIHQEATAVFYTRNIFRVDYAEDEEGEGTWWILRYWLKTIGSQNRNNLTTIGIRFEVPSRVHQHSDGSRKRWLAHYGKRKAHPLNPHLTLPRKPVKGNVENISPAIEKIFKLIGSRRTRKLTIAMLLRGDILPGNYVLPNVRSDTPERVLLSMDMPNLIEKFRTMYNCSKEGGRLVDIVWKGNCNPSRFEQGSRFLERVGWEIVNTSKGRENIYIPPFNRKHFLATTRFTLRRKALSGPLIAEPPVMHRMSRCKFEKRVGPDVSEDEEELIRKRYY